MSAGYHQARALHYGRMRLVWPLLVPLAWAGVDAVGVFLVAIWTGWLATVAAAEAWIRRTRPPARVIAAAHAA